MAHAVSIRNKEVYHIDLEAAFKRRIEREGIPMRLPASVAFCVWFSGFTDAEGSFSARLQTWRTGNRAGQSFLQVGFSIGVRDDDARVIQEIHTALKVGGVRRTKSKNSRGAIYWDVRGTRDLMEVVVPLLQRYPLRTKKTREFEIWTRLVLNRYMRTGGYARKFGKAGRSVISPAEYRAIAADCLAIERIKDEGQTVLGRGARRLRSA